MEAYTPYIRQPGPKATASQPVSFAGKKPKRALCRPENACLPASPRQRATAAKNRSQGPWLSALLLACILAVTGPVPQAKAAPGPLDAVHTAQQGIEQCDPDLFRNAVDVDAVFDSGFDALLSALAEGVRSGSIGGDNLLLVMAVSGLEGEDSSSKALLKQLLASEAKSFVAAGISGGYFAGAPNGKVTDSGAFSSLLKDVSKGRKQLIPGGVLSRKDGEAVISARLVDEEAGSFPLKLRLEEESGGWRVKEVLNARELLHEANRRN